MLDPILGKKIRLLEQDRTTEAVAVLLDRLSLFGRDTEHGFISSVRLLLRER